MEFFDRIPRLAARLPQQLPILKTDEATKNAVGMPLINALGYNVFDPHEVIPEFTAEVGTKKLKTVEHANVMGDKPLTLAECTAICSTLDVCWRAK